MYRCMQERLRELTREVMAENGSTTGQKCEQALAMASLAAFLSYIFFGEWIAQASQGTIWHGSRTPARHLLILQ
jgi:hypothetical protein